MKKHIKTPLLQALIKNKKKGIIPFHMPGHKKGQGIVRTFSKVMTEDPFGLDLTEIPGMDDLHHPTGVIKEAQDQAAQLFGAEQTHFLVNGTTVGIHAAIMSVCGVGDQIILPRDVHRSVIGACILSGAVPVYLSTKLDPLFMIPYPPLPVEMGEVLERNPGAKALFQTYPSYYGLAGDLTEAARLAHRKGLPLLVDEAHGAHFAFSSLLPETALKSGADISIQSTHKVLGAFTQASMLHIKSNLIERARVAGNLKLLQSTSPSYLLMASLDAATGHMAASGLSLMERTVAISEEVRRRVNQIPGMNCLGEEVTGQNNVTAVDPTKLLISAIQLGLTGYQLEKMLLKKYGIQVELSDRYNILCMLTMGNTREDGHALIKALEDIGAKYRPIAGQVFMGNPVNVIPVPKVVISPREAWLSKRKKVLLKEAEGLISAEMIAPYPPGIPVLCPGEEITGEVIACIDYFKAHQHAFHGPADPDLLYIEITDN